MRSPQERWGKNGYKYKCQPKFWNAIQKYGWDNFEHIILEENLTQEEANFKEQFYINYYNSYICGYNANEGGRQVLPMTISSRKKMSEIMKEKQLGANNSNAKQCICLNDKNYFQTIKQAAEFYNISPTSIGCSLRKGYGHFGGTNPKTGEVLYWSYLENYFLELQKKFDSEKKFLIHKKNQNIKPIMQINKNTGENIKEFKNARQAAIELFNDAKKASKIRACANGKRFSAYGYIWRDVR